MTALPSWLRTLLVESMPMSLRRRAWTRARAGWARADAWAHAGPVRAAVTKVLLSVVGVVVILAGVAMLVLPGPGLVAIVLGLAVLAAEWDWAKALLHRARLRLEAARAAALPRHSSLGRRVWVGVSAVLMGAASWLVSALLMGASPSMVLNSLTGVVGAFG